jgi:hypothetical protein
MHPRRLSSTLNWQGPGNPPLNELFHLRPQLGFCQGEVINHASAQYRHSREASATAIHKGSTCLAEVVGHARVGAYRFCLAECGEVILTTDMLEMRIRHSDVGLVEGGSNLSTVDAMTDMAIYEAGFLKWL